MVLSHSGPEVEHRLSSELMACHRAGSSSKLVMTLGALGSAERALAARRTNNRHSNTLKLCGHIVILHWAAV